ncbi:DUF1109 domain-containing protein [Pendulispora brunnea]|uniref:DUF1109 domain-containing protein n=1 Tax=Pendulispora brunnea TaxID=2905690 RepID=A0ABZ2KGB0_9BACT
MMPSSPKPSADLRARILEAARQEPAPDRARVTQTTRALVVLAIVSALTVFFAMGGFRLGGRPLGYVVTTGIGWGIVAAFATHLAFSRRKSMLGPTRQALVAAALLIAPILLAWAALWTVSWPEVTVFDSTWSNYLSCFTLTSVFGILPLIALTIARRGSDPVHPRSTGAALGAAMGAWAGTLIDLHCRCASIPHIAFSHVLPTIMLAVLGALVGPRILGL